MADIAVCRVDRILCAGDIVGYGPNPSGCIARLRQMEIDCVGGNFDCYVGEQIDCDGVQPVARDSILWTRGACCAEDKAYLRTLPKTLTFGGIQVAHTLTVTNVPETKGWDYILSVDDAQKAFHAATGQVVFFGHSHIQSAFLDEKPVSCVTGNSFAIPAGVKALINPGSVGQPRDGDPRASWALYETGTRTVEFRRCAYDVQQTADKILQAGLPERLARRLSLGR